MIAPETGGAETQFATHAFREASERAVNEWIGRIAGALLTTTLLLFRAVHYEHHSRTNDPRRDPELARRSTSRASRGGAGVGKGSEPAGHPQDWSEGFRTSRTMVPSLTVQIDVCMASGRKEAARDAPSASPSYCSRSRGVAASTKDRDRPQPGACRRRT